MIGHGIVAMDLVEVDMIGLQTARNKQPADIAPMPGKQEEKPITQGLQTGKAREDYPFKDPAKRGKGRPMGSVNRYTGALKELSSWPPRTLATGLRSGQMASVPSQSARPSSL